jgi:hypothetical protein
LASGRAVGAASGAALTAIDPNWEVMFVSDELLGTKVLLATDSSEGTELATKSAVELANLLVWW